MKLFAGGTWPVKVNSSPVFVAEVPSGVVTVTSTVRLEGLEGLVAVTELSELKVTFVAATPPKSTAVSPVKPTPAMVTVVPPARGPKSGETELTTGGVCAAAIPAGTTVPTRAANPAPAYPNHRSLCRRG